MQVNKRICTVVSIVPFEINEAKPGVYPGNFKIAPGSIKEPTTVEVGESCYYLYIGEGKGDSGKDRESIKMRVLPEEMARSIVEDYLHAQMDYKLTCHPGIFWVNDNFDPKRHQGELANAQVVQLNWFRELVKTGDDDWEKTRQHKAISDIQRYAARALNQEKPWSIEINPNLIQAVELTECIACKFSIRKDCIICPNCKVILNKKEYENLMFAKVV